jgi:capsular exopolysaccharide synthesis family protein
VHRLLRLPNALGLSNLLAGGATLEQVLQPGGDEHLEVVTSGPLPPNPPELLAGEGLQALLAALQERCDVVVLDGPPVLGLADAPLLSHRAEGTLLVAAAEETRREALHGAFERLLAARAHVLGSLLIRFDPGKGGQYGYGSYAYYSYGGGKDD